MIRILIIVVTALLSGCAISYTDEVGFEHTIGLIHSKVKVTDELIMLDKASFGFTLDMTDTEQGFNLGFKSQERVYLKNDLSLSIDRNNREVSVERY